MTSLPSDNNFIMKILNFLHSWQTRNGPIDQPADGWIDRYAFWTKAIPIDWQREKERKKSEKKADAHAHAHAYTWTEKQTNEVSEGSFFLFIPRSFFIFPISKKSSSMAPSLSFPLFLSVCLSVCVCLPLYHALKLSRSLFRYLFLSPSVSVSVPVCLFVYL